APELGRRWLVALLVAAYAIVNLLFMRGAGRATLAPALMFGVAFLSIQTWQRRRWPKAALAQLGAGATQFRFEDYGLTVNSSLRQQRFAWSALSRFIQAPTAFLIYTTPRAVFVVPKRAFRDVDIARIAERLKAKI